MSLAADFNDNDYGTRKINDYVLGVSYNYGGGSTTYYTYDFLARVLTVRTGSSDGGAFVVPFSRLDRDSLDTLRERLVQLGGKPPAPGGDAGPSLPPSGRSLNL